jgi:hypothetical protein
VNNNFFQPQPGNDFPPEFWLIFGVILAVALAIGLVIAIFYFRTLSWALYLVRPRNRQMEPGAVWLNLIMMMKAPSTAEMIDSERLTGTVKETEKMTRTKKRANFENNQLRS